MLSGGQILCIILGGFLAAGLLTGTIVAAIYGSQNTTSVAIVDSSLHSIGLDGSYGGPNIDCVVNVTRGLTIGRTCQARTSNDSGSCNCSSEGVVLSLGGDLGGNTSIAILNDVATGGNYGGPGIDCNFTLLSKGLITQGDCVPRVYPALPLGGDLLGTTEDALLPDVATGGTFGGAGIDCSYTFLDKGLFILSSCASRVYPALPLSGDVTGNTGAGVLATVATGGTFGGLLSICNYTFDSKGRYLSSICVPRPVMSGDGGVIVGYTDEIVVEVLPDNSTQIRTVQPIGTSSTPTFAGLTLTTPLSLANGGTGETSFADFMQGTTNQVIFTGTSPVVASLPQSIATTSTPTFAGLTLTTPLSLANGGTGETTFADYIQGTTDQITFTGTSPAVASLPQSIATTSTPTFAGLTLTAPLSLANGGTGETTFTDFLQGTANQVIFTGTSPAVASLPQSIATTSTPTFAGLTLTTPLSQANGGTGTTSLVTGVTPAIYGGDDRLIQVVVNLNGGLTFAANGSTAVTTTTLATFFQGTSDQVIFTGTNPVIASLPQSIATTSTPTFAGLTLTTPLSLANGGTGETSFTDFLQGTTNQVIFTGTSPAVASLPQSIATTSTPTFAGLTLTTPLSLANGGTGETTFADFMQGTTNQVIFTGTSPVVASLPQSIATTSTPTFAGLTLTTPLSLANGGTGETTFTDFLQGTTNQVIFTGTSPAVASLPQSIATTSTPTFAGLTLTTPLSLANGGTGETSFTDFLQGTANQVIFTGTSPVVASLPQSIATTSTPIFGGLEISDATSATLNLKAAGATQPNVQMSTFGSGNHFIAFDLEYTEGWNATSSAYSGMLLYKFEDALQILIAPVVPAGTAAAPVAVATVEATGVTFAAPPKVSTFGGGKVVVTSGTSMVEGPAFSYMTPVVIESTGAADRGYAISAIRIGTQVTVTVCEEDATTFTAAAATVTIDMSAHTNYIPPTFAACGIGGISREATIGTEGAICISTAGIITMGEMQGFPIWANGPLTGGDTYHMGCLSVTFHRP